LGPPEGKGKGKGGPPANVGKGKEKGKPQHAGKGKSFGGNSGSKGIGKLVSEMAKSGIKGKELAQQIEQLLEARGFGKGNPGPPEGLDAPGSKGKGKALGKGKQKGKP